LIVLDHNSTDRDFALLFCSLRQPDGMAHPSFIGGLTYSHSIITYVC
jgi:hypothetical protein